MQTQEVLARRLVTARAPVSFADLVDAAAPNGALVSEVADWLGAVRSTGLVEDLGFAQGDDGAAVGPRLFRLRQRGRFERG